MHRNDERYHHGVKIPETIARGVLLIDLRRSA